MCAKAGPKRSWSPWGFQTNTCGGQILAEAVVEAAGSHWLLLFSSFAGQAWKMQDEEGYTVLNLQAQENSTVRLTPGQIQDSSSMSQSCKLPLGILGAVCLILALAVILLSVPVFQGSSHNGQTGPPPSTPVDGESGQRRPSSSPEGVLAHLRQNLCQFQSQDSAAAGASECRLCPMDWLSHSGQCYWFSKGNRDWNGSKEDCSRKRSRLLVIQDQEEMVNEFIQKVTQGKYPVWIGLTVTSPEGRWTWVDGSSLNPNLFPVSGLAVRNSCGVIKGNEIRSEMCSAEFKWICQKKAVLI
ncbi:killer cell lectin-like receptor subfamily F member 1 isoform X1 [Pelodiscus sinensis]|uniref:killer cell lectin-like receptor subfamily F member 1 isoform X1 n=1 Tax=Pelodiscus sinensis TaxID=13735 RepID=UPI003F6A7238